MIPEITEQALVIGSIGILLLVLVIQFAISMTKTILKVSFLILLILGMVTIGRGCLMVHRVVSDLVEPSPQYEDKNLVEKFNLD